MQRRVVWRPSSRQRPSSKQDGLFTKPEPSNLIHDTFLHYTYTVPHHPIRYCTKRYYGYLRKNMSRLLNDLKEFGTSFHGLRLELAVPSYGHVDLGPEGKNMM